MAQKKNKKDSLDIRKEHFHVGTDKIVVKGARTHNLKNIDVEMPRNAMVAITGLSGSGKSSLAFDTIFAEGQRRYVESLSPYARQFLNQMSKPEVDEITGLSPAISIDQKTASRNPRSTVATITEIYDYLRVLFARIGKPYSPITGSVIKKMSIDEIVRFVKEKIKASEQKENADVTKKSVMGVSWDERVIQVYAPVVRGRKGEYYQMLYDFLNAGYLYVRIDGKIKSLRDKIVIAKNKKHDIDLLIDELSVHELHDDVQDFDMRITDAIEKSMHEAEGLLKVVLSETDIDSRMKDPALNNLDKDEEFIMSAKLVSAEDGFSFPEIEPRLFSFNSPYGACPECKGLGTKHLFGNEHDDECEVCRGMRLRREAGFVFLGDETIANKYIEKIYDTETSLPDIFIDVNGRVKKNVKNWKRPGLNVYEFTQLTIEDAHEFMLELDLSKKEMEIAGILLNEIESRLQFMLNVGLGYLSLNRRANTLSGGEAQRIRLASQLGSKLVGAMYVLDEPTIGLHERDNERLVKTLTDLRDAGNTILVVEHDEEVVRASDYIIDIGPGAGRFGGKVIAQGYLEDFLDKKRDTTEIGSLTLDYLKGDKKIDTPQLRRSKKKGFLEIVGGKVNNIENLNVKVPLGRMVVITGVSGSGKSSFMYKIVYNNLRARYERKYRSAEIINAAAFVGDNSVTRTVMVDQAPIGRTPRSNPATYTGMWTHIRDLFASTSEARLRGWKPSRFSFNVKGGRCEACQGRGEIPVEMHFLPTVYVQCDVCHGKRFNKETLAVDYKKKNIYDILELTVEQAFDFFKDIPAVYDRLKTLMDVGLTYVKLGQPANTLSGGESQRVKIASELYRRHTEKTIYLLDEPTVGLHFHDVAKLIEILNRLVDKGHSVILIEHNLEVIKSADYIIDFGPEGGTGGGTIVAKGTPEEVAQSKKSHTGRFLRKIL